MIEIGQIFYDLEVLGFNKDKSTKENGKLLPYTHRYYDCLCKCGNIKPILVHHLKSGHTKSCGCRKGSISIINIKNNYAEVTLTNSSEVALIDIEDIHLIEGRAWYLTKRNSVECRIGYKLKKMHRIVMGEPEGVIDHISGNILDNRKINLRECSTLQNMQNIQMRSDNTSGYTGVIWNKTKKRWSCTITYKGKTYYLGSSKTDPYMLHLRYVEKSKELRGDFAFQNRGKVLKKRKEL